MMDDLWVSSYDMETELTLLSSMQGGRSTGIFSGYRGGHVYLDDIDWIAQLDLKDQSMLEPGCSARVYVTFPYHAECLIGRLQVGKRFLLREGGQVVGSGVILSLINFMTHAQQAVQLYGPCDTPPLTSLEK